MHGGVPLSLRHTAATLLAVSPLWLMIGLLVYSVRSRRRLRHLPQDQHPPWLRGPSLRAGWRSWWVLPRGERTRRGADGIAAALADGAVGEVILWVLGAAGLWVLTRLFGLS